MTHKWTPEDDKLILALVVDGKTDRDAFSLLRRKLGVSRHALRNRMHKLGLTAYGRARGYTQVVEVDTTPVTVEKLLLKFTNEMKPKPVLKGKGKDPDLTPIEYTVFINDVHIPYQDPKALRSAISLIRLLKPAHIKLVGDMLDFYQLSRFNADPNRLTKLQEDLDTLFLVLSEIREAAPDAKIDYFEGNHEYRLTRYLWEHPEICNLECMQINNLFRLDELDINWIPQSVTHEHHGIVVTHGEVVRKYGAYTARGMLERYGKSGISGHTHRQGATSYTNHSGSSTWWENFCLCTMKPEYLIGTPDWQQGLAVGEYNAVHDTFTIHQYPIIKGELQYHGFLFK